jgi:hypothetical protein
MDNNEIEQIYLDLIRPSVLITAFNNDQEFIDWLKIGDVVEMKWALKAFEREELYHHCNLIKKEIALFEQNNKI